MMNKQQFDAIIKRNLEAKLGGGAFGYIASEGGEVYGNYYSNREFDFFLEEMKSPRYNSIFSAYNGSKRELREHRERGKLLPPKMASAASSSRFCYLALRDGGSALGGTGAVKFEYGCPICGIKGTAPQADACMEAEGIYIEAKCHEIFDAHKLELSKQYWGLLYGPGNDFGLPEREGPAGKTFELSLRDFGIEGKSTMFDLKQFLCHLLGVKCQKKREPTLCYLFFRPMATDTEEETQLAEVFPLWKNRSKPSSPARPSGISRQSTTSTFGPQWKTPRSWVR